MTSVIGWLMIGWLGLGVPRLDVPAQTALQMGYISGVGSYIQMERTSLWVAGNHQLQLSMGMAQIGDEGTLFLRGRWDYRHQGFHISIMGTLPMYHTALRAFP